MAIAPIQILTRPQQDGVGSILSQGTRVLTDALSDAVAAGRQAADLQFNQENAFLRERDRIDLLNERKGNELRRRYESDRAFTESILRDRRDFEEGVRQFGIGVGLRERGLALQERGLGLQERGMDLREDEFGLRERQFDEVTLPAMEANSDLDELRRKDLNLGIKMKEEALGAEDQFIKEVESMTTPQAPVESLGPVTNGSLGILGGENAILGAMYGSGAGGSVLPARPDRERVINELRALDPEMLRSNLPKFGADTRGLIVEALKLGPIGQEQGRRTAQSRADYGGSLLSTDVPSLNTSPAE